MPYVFDDFIKACAAPGNATVAYDAKKGAEQFNFLTESALLAFIGSGGLDDCTYINTEVWHLNPNKPPDINVDAYSFYSGDKFGYIAFMFIQSTNKWRIKSFKPNTKPDPKAIKDGLKHLPFEKLISILNTDEKGE